MISSLIGVLLLLFPAKLDQVFLFDFLFIGSTTSSQV